MGRIPRSASVLAAAILVTACSSASYAGLNRDGNDLYEQGRFSDALELYQRAQAERPDRPELSYNAGNALHRMGEYERAVEETRRSFGDRDAEMLARAYYSLGNHFFRSGSLTSAFESYKNALIYDPSDRGAKHNLEVALGILSQEEQPPQIPTPGAGPSDPSPTSGASPAPPGASPQPAQEEGEQPAEGGEGPGPGDSPEERFSSMEEYQRALEEALAGIDEEFTIEEALRVLEVLEQRFQESNSLPSTQANPAYRDW